MNEKGRMCEELVATYLKEQGYEVQARNYRGKRGEVDIIACKGEVLCFVEVKSLTAAWTADQIANMVGALKRRRIRLTAMDYLAKVEHGGQWVLRFDVASVTDGQVAYYEGVF